MAQGNNIGNNDRLRSSKFLWAIYWVFIMASIFPFDILFCLI